MIFQYKLALRKMRAATFPFLSCQEFNSLHLSRASVRKCRAYQMPICGPTRHYPPPCPPINLLALFKAWYGRAWDHGKEIIFGSKNEASAAKGDGNKVNFNNNKKVAIGEQKNFYMTDENPVCTQLRVNQPEAPTEKQLTNAELSWVAPKPRRCKVSSFKIIIRSDNKGDIHSKVLRGDALPKYAIPTGLLECGEKYYVRVVCLVQYEKGTEKVPYESVERDFFTRPSKPKNITVSCNDQNICVKWSVCKGADKYGIHLFDEDGKDTLKYDQKPGNEHECTFKIDNERGIYLGRNYRFQVTAVKGEWENASGKQKEFVGEKDTPKAVFAVLKGEDNTVHITWKAPDKSPNEYTIKVSPESVNSTPNNTRNTYADAKNLKAGVTYVFGVAAVYSNSQSQWSWSNSITTKSCTVAVEGFRLEPNTADPATSFHCHWTRTSGAVGYKIRYRHGDNVTRELIGKNVSKYTLTNLRPYTEYCVAIRAQDSKGFGPYGESEKFTTGLQRIRGGRIAVAGDDSTKLVVNFEAVAGVTSYKVKVYDGDGGESCLYSLKSCETRLKVDQLAYNKLHHAGITAMIGDKSGEEFETEKILTVPSEPERRKITCLPADEDKSSLFDVSWEPEPNCFEYDVRVQCQDDPTERHVFKSETKNGQKSVLQCRCKNVGGIFQVRLRARNKGGYSNWSEQMLVKLAPARVKNVKLRFSEETEGKIEASWGSVMHTSAYVLTLFERREDGTPEKISQCEVKDVASKFARFDWQHGATYFCEVFAQNQSGEGEKAVSKDLLSPLIPPTDLRCSEYENWATITWKPSRGMTSAKLSVYNTNLTKSVHYSKFRGNSLTIPVRLGEKYCVTVWGRNGDYLSRDTASLTFATAPSKVIATRNEKEPETSLEVHVVAAHDGPFWLYVKEKRGGAESERFPREKISYCKHVLEGLEPATDYEISVSCAFGNEQSRECLANPIMTLPSKVTRVECNALELPTQKELKWKGCGNPSVDYTVTWTRDDQMQYKIKTKATSREFSDLKPGSYQFWVSAGGGVESDPRFIVVLDTPVLTVEPISQEIVRVKSTSIRQAQEYVFTLFDGDVEKKSWETTDTCVLIKSNDFRFSAGVKYTMTCQAKWNKHLSIPAKQNFMTGLKEPTEFRCVLDSTSPTTTVHCSWEPSEGTKQSRISILDSSHELVAEEKLFGANWSCDRLSPNQTYEVRVYSGDSERIYPEFITETFITAPGAPSSVQCKVNMQSPDTMIDVTIESDYSGPFMVTVLDDEENVIREIPTMEKYVTVEDLTPGASFQFYAQCNFNGRLLGKTSGVQAPGA